jgi:large subunit ribosomal protein L25
MMDEAEVVALIRDHEHTIEVNLEGVSGTLLLKEVQYDHLGDDILHLDFKRVAHDEVVEVNVEIQTIGTPRGVLAGGLLETVEFDLPVRCKATSIPDSIELNIAELEIGDSIRISDLPAMEGAEPVGDPEQIVIVIHAPKVEAETDLEEEGDEPTLPERIGEKPSEEDSE